MIDKLNFSNFSDLLKEKLYDCDCTIYLCYGSSVFPEPEQIPKIIAEYHDSVTGGYRGINKCYRRVREKFYWASMKNDITEYIRTCEKCKLNKLVKIKNRQQMIITDIPIEPFYKISIDTIGLYHRPPAETNEFLWQRIIS